MCAGSRRTCGSADLAHARSLFVIADESRCRLDAEAGVPESPEVPKESCQTLESQARSLEMPSKKQQEIPVSSFVSKFADAKKENLTFLTRGYVGSVDDKVVRMYLDLSLETYVDIPRSAVVHAQPVKDDLHERSELMVMGTGDIRLVHQQTHTIKAQDLQRAIDDQRNQATDPKRELLAGASTVAPDPCAKPPTKLECGCGGAAARKPGLASKDEEQAGRDPMREAARWMLGPFGRLL